MGEDKVSKIIVWCLLAGAVGLACVAFFIGSGKDNGKVANEPTIATATTVVATTGEKYDGSLSKYRMSNYVSVQGVYTDPPNSAGGVNLQIDYTNGYCKNGVFVDLKYIYFTVEAYNAVGDVVSDEISGSSERSCQITGPIYGGTHTSHFKCAWYNNTVDSAKVIQTKVVLMTGDEYTFDASGKCIDAVE